MNVRGLILLFVFLFHAFVPRPVAAATNEWTKTTSGSWEEPFWSLGVLPSFDQDLVAFRNSGFKALAISANTTANFTNSLNLNYLTVDAPAGSANQLLLNYAGLDIPLHVNSDLIIGTNGSLASHSSALTGGTLYLSGHATISDSSQVTFSSIRTGIEAAMTLALNNSSLSAGLLVLGQNTNSTVNQTGGSTEITHLLMHSGTAYNLTNGTFTATTADVHFQGTTAGLAKFTQSGGSADIDDLRLGFPAVSENIRGEYLLASGLFRSSNIYFVTGTFVQTGGTNQTENIELPWLQGTSEYQLSGGTMISERLSLGTVFPPGEGTFIQSGGIHTNALIVFEGRTRSDGVTVFGHYHLTAGLLVCENAVVRSGYFAQSGGTNLTTELQIEEGGSFLLAGGELVSSNFSMQSINCVQSSFVQSNGNHRVLQRLAIEDFVSYELRGGTLTVPDLRVGPGADFVLVGGSITNPGTLTLDSGRLRVGGSAHQLGKLLVIGDPVPACFSFEPRGPTLDVGHEASGPGTVLNFQDSSDLAWSGTGLSIANWNGPTAGSAEDHIFVGNDSQGLTAAQVALVRFVNPVGWPQGSYPARILNTGEIVPAVLPPITFTINPDALVLSWESDYSLLTSTNVTGPFVEVPGATPPYTNQFTDPQRFFLLSEPAP